jgi:hypothetical protein
MAYGKKELLEDISDVRRLAGLTEAPPKAAPKKANPQDIEGKGSLGGIFGNPKGSDYQSQGGQVVSPQGKVNWGDPDSASDFFRADRMQQAQQAAPKPAAPKPAAPKPAPVQTNTPNFRSMTAPPGEPQGGYDAKKAADARAQADAVQADQEIYGTFKGTAPAALATGGRGLAAPQPAPAEPAWRTPDPRLIKQQGPRDGSNDTSAPAKPLGGPVSPAERDGTDAPAKPLGGPVSPAERDGTDKASAPTPAINQLQPTTRVIQNPGRLSDLGVGNATADTVLADKNPTTMKDIVAELRQMAGLDDSDEDEMMDEIAMDKQGMDMAVEGEDAPSPAETGEEMAECGCDDDMSPMTMANHSEPEQVSVIPIDALAQILKIAGMR